MKIIIKESKRNQIVTDWLDKNYGDLIKQEYNYLDWYVNKSDVAIFAFSYYDKRLIVLDPHLVSMLDSVFSITPHSSQRILIPWFERNYNIEKIDVVVYH